MAFSKYDLDAIKSKLSLSREIEKKTNVIKKGKDTWCCCLFHDEKTPSLKINDDLGSYYCFGCGAKGDIFSLYTDLYNYSFLDAVKELSEKAGININFQDNQSSSQNNNIDKIFSVNRPSFFNYVFLIFPQKVSIYVRIKASCTRKFKIQFIFK